MAMLSVHDQDSSGRRRRSRPTHNPSAIAAVRERSTGEGSRRTPHVELSVVR